MSNLGSDNNNTPEVPQGKEKNSIANIIKVSTALGLGAAGLVGGISQSEELSTSELAQASSKPPVIRYDQAQNKYKATDAARVSEINSVIDQAIRTGNIKTVLKRSKLSSQDKKILSRLNSRDLKQIQTLQRKLRGIADKASDGDTTGVIIW